MPNVAFRNPIEKRCRPRFAKGDFAGHCKAHPLATASTLQGTSTGNGFHPAVSQAPRLGVS